MKVIVLLLQIFLIRHSFCGEQVLGQIIKKHSDREYTVIEPNHTVIYEQLRDTFWQRTCPPKKGEFDIKEISKVEFDTIALAYQHQESKTCRK